MLAHPNLPDCETCRHWLFDEKWQVRRYPNQDPMERPAQSRPPCSRCPKCQQERIRIPMIGQRNQLSPQNRRMLSAYYRARAGGPGPRDAVAAAAFGRIAEIMETYDRQQRRGMLQVLSVKGSTPW